MVLNVLLRPVRDLSNDRPPSLQPVTERRHRGTTCRGPIVFSTALPTSVYVIPPQSPVRHEARAGDATMLLAPGTRAPAQTDHSPRGVSLPNFNIAKRWGLGPSPAWPATKET